MKLSSNITIMGGGLAGMTLALQLRNSLPDLAITIIDKNSYPAPEKAFKIGESFVEVSSWYLGKVLGLRDYLLKDHLPKFGLRFFMNNENTTDFGQRSEYGLFQIPAPPKDFNSSIPAVHFTTFNVDRGKLENHLFHLCQDQGINMYKGFKIDSFELGKPHNLTFSQNGTTYSLNSDWLIDTSGKSALINKKLKTRAQVDHSVNCSWFRIEGRIDPDKFSKNKLFHSRTFSNIRWLSTNHLIGEGYWMWIIPLPDSGTSVGVMMNPEIHNNLKLNNYEKCYSWLLENEPELAAEVLGKKILDFVYMKSDAYQNRVNFSRDRWAICGEASFFSDALYSPGADFIAVGNTVIHNIVSAYYQEDHVKMLSNMKFGEQLLSGMYNHYIGLYKGNYELMKNPGAMVQKVAWDTAVYFGYNVLLFRNGKFCDLDFHQKIRAESAKLEQLQIRMIRQLKDYNQKTQSSLKERYFDQVQLDPLTDLYQCLQTKLSEEDLIKQLKTNLNLLESFSNSIGELVA